MAIHSTDDDSAPAVGKQRSRLTASFVGLCAWTFILIRVAVDKSYDGLHPYVPIGFILGGIALNIMFHVQFAQLGKLVTSSYRTWTVLSFFLSGWIIGYPIIMFATRASRFAGGHLAAHSLRDYSEGLFRMTRILSFACAILACVWFLVEEGEPRDEEWLGLIVLAGLGYAAPIVVVKSWVWVRQGFKS